MKLIATLFALTLASATAFAGSLSEAKNPVRCDVDNGGYAFQLPAENQTTRVWLTEGAADKEGLELEVKDVQTFRCPYCFAIEAKMDLLGEPVNYLFNLKGANSGRGFVPGLEVSLNGQAVGSFSCTLTK